MHAAAGEAKASVDYLKQVDLLAQLAYDIEFALPASPPNPEVEATTLKDEILLSWDNLAESYNQIDVIDKLPIPVSFDTTFSTMINDIITTTIDTTIDGSDTTITTTIDTTFEYIQVVERIDTTFQGDDTYFTFEGYNVYQHETESGSGVTKRIATYDLNNGLTEIYDDVFSPDLGQSINRVVQHGSDSGIKRTLFIDKDQLNGGSPLKTNRNYYFSVTSYGYNPYGIPKTLESASKIMLIKPQVPNNWAADAETAEIGALISSSHVGGSDGTIMVKVVDPTKLTGDTYEVSINMGHFYRDLNGVWQTAATDSTIGAAKTLDCSGSTLTASAIASAAVGTVDLTFTFDMVCGSNWVDGIQLDLPDDLTVNSWDAIGECDYGAGSGQNCVNMDGTLDATTNTITWGDSARSGFGAIQGGQVWIVNVSPPASYPISVEYDVWDDGYDATIVDASGSASVSELGYDFKTFQHWNVENTTTGAMVVEDQTMVSGISYENVVNGALVPGTTGLGETANPVFDGIQVMVNGPTNGIHGVWQTANANGPIAGVDSDVNENVMWINFLTAPDYPTEQAQGGWFFAVHGGGTPNDMESFYARVFRGSNFTRAIPNDFEMRFTADALTTGMGYRRFEDGLIMGGVPFELWNIRSTPDDASDDYRMLPAILNYGGDNADAYDFGGEDAHSSADNDPSSDWVYWGNPDDMSPGTAGYDAWIVPGAGSSPAGGWTEVLARTRLMNWNGYVSTQDSVLLSEMSSTDTLAWTAADTATLLERGWFLSGVNSMGHWSVEADANGVDHVWGIILNDPEVGTVYRMITNKPNTTEDTFAFTTDGITGNGSIVYEPGNINVWPNPYFGYNPEERNPLDQRVQFTHLPDDGSSSKIRIFDLAGQPIRTISHDGSSQSVDWDLTNNYNVPVSSGMYLAYVETSEGSKILKVGIVQPEQRIDVY